ncbi:MAG TPA: sulfurtransferase [Desulfobulbus sp.]|nr:sulfurtransferase [Desulfobulbus sp.]
MKNKLLQSLIFIVLVVAAGCMSVPATTVTAGTTPLVTTQWLENNLGDKDLVVIDVRTTTNYGVGHIPGSYNIPYIGWEPMDPKTECQLMPKPEDLTRMLQAIGLNPSSHVIVYDHGNSIGDSTKGCATVWILEAIGHTNVSYLNGGFTKWTFEGRIIDNKVPESRSGTFVARLDGSKVSTLKQIQDTVKKKDAVLVDARNSNQHFGADKRADVERFGHIPGSINLPAPFLNNAGANRAPATIRDSKQLAQMVKGVGIPGDKDANIIVYCNTGQFAGMDYFVLHDILGYKNVGVYDGSMLEYGADDDLPLEKFSWGRRSR